MLRVLLGIGIGIYLAQNYDVPDANLYLQLARKFAKDFEKNLQEKSKK